MLATTRNSAYTRGHMVSKGVFQFSQWPVNLESQQAATCAKSGGPEARVTALFANVVRTVLILISYNGGIIAIYQRSLSYD
jgi:hypothetical protein